MNNDIVNAYHIFAPAAMGANWVETLLGEVILQFWQPNQSKIDWIWVTRYVERIESVYQATTAHGETRTIPDEFINNGLTRRIIFRAVGEAGLINKEVLALCDVSNLHVRVTPWDIVEDLGSNRFIEQSATTEQRRKRAHLVGKFVSAAVELALNCLELNDNGEWSFEKNTHEQNPTGSMFFSIHHLFCNLTDLTIPVQIAARTHFSPGIPDDNGWFLLKS